MKQKIKFDTAEKVLTFGLDNNLEIVSYGLAPNPNGFCFESHGKASESVKREFSKMLEALNSDEVKKLRSWL